MTEGSSLIELSAVEKRFGRDAPIFQGISFGIAEGEFVSLLGPSGCGKSTLLRLIASLSAPTSGTITVAGKSPADAREAMAFIFQEATLLPWLTVGGNVEMLLRLRGVARERRREITDGLLRRVQLQDVRKRFPRQLSGGMKMRVSIARALSVSPRILLLDEPFGSLDELTRNHLNEELLSMRENAAWTSLFVTHSVAEAVFLSSRILVMGAKPGRICADIPVAFPYPRSADTREAPEFSRLVADVAHVLRTVEADGS